MTIIAEEKDTQRRTPLQDFYAGQNVFITGGTGFLGKILIEKLLRSCPDLASIYMLVRPKKGKDVHNRMEDIFDNPVFSRLKKEVPKFRHKIVTVMGDCSLPGLGLSTTDRALLLREVTIVFHAAATVRFDEKIKLAVAINVSGAREMMELCRCMHNLKSVIHVSTAYSNCNRSQIDEIFYAPPITGENLTKLIQSLDDKKLDSITPTLLDDFPNTYAFTKAIAEDTVKSCGKDLPLGVFRPAIVMSTNFEPIEGWIDNVYGPMGAVVGVGAGLIRTINCDADCTAELIPVDLTVNAMIATAWDVATNKNENADPPIYNYLTWGSNFTWSRFMSTALKYGKQTPATRSLWCYSLTITKITYLYYLLTLILHLLPALIIDTGLFLTRHEPRMMKIYKKIHKFLTVITYFSTRKWDFSNKNTRALWAKLSPEDQDTFFFSMKDFDWDGYMKKCIAGVRIHIFKDDPSTIPAALKRMSRITLLHKFIKYTLLGLLLWGLYSLTYAVFSSGLITGSTPVIDNLVIR